MRTEPVVDASAWKASEMVDDSSWKVQLSEQDLRELDAALEGVKAAGISFEQIACDDFPLPHLSVRLAEWLRELKHGRGFLLIRGFPVERYSLDDIRKLYFGMSRYLGTPVSQNAYGELVESIQNEGLKVAPGEFRGSRGYRGTGKLLFHTDRSDIIGLLCMQPAKEGGLSCLLSATTAYNEFLDNHPEYLETLYRGFITPNSDEDSDGSKPRRPMFTLHEDVVSCRLSRNAVDRGRAAGLPSTELEAGALAYLDELGARDDLRLDMDFKAGDIQFINNFTIFHSRSAYVDDPDPARRRHLLRIWLQTVKRRPLSPAHYTDYNGIPKTLARKS
jgi:hypothetical protein